MTCSGSHNKSERGRSWTLKSKFQSNAFITHKHNFCSSWKNKFLWDPEHQYSQMFLSHCVLWFLLGCSQSRLSRLNSSRMILEYFAYFIKLHLKSDLFSIAIRVETPIDLNWVPSKMSMCTPNASGVCININGSIKNYPFECTLGKVWYLSDAIRCTQNYSTIKIHGLYLNKIINHDTTPHSFHGCHFAANLWPFGSLSDNRDGIYILLLQINRPLTTWAKGDSSWTINSIAPMTHSQAFLIPFSRGLQSVTTLVTSLYH